MIKQFFEQKAHLRYWSLPCVIPLLNLSYLQEQPDIYKLPALHLCLHPVIYSAGCGVSLLSREPKAPNPQSKVIQISAAKRPKADES